jgi:hypothetical protein
MRLFRLQGGRKAVGATRAGQTRAQGEAAEIPTAGRTRKIFECLRMRIRISLFDCDSWVSMCHVSTTAQTHL